jgi:hypothetical protein
MKVIEELGSRIKELESESTGLGKISEGEKNRMMERIAELEEMVDISEREKKLITLEKDVIAKSL